MALLVPNEIYLIEIIVAVVEIIGAILLFALLAYIMVRNKKLAGSGEDNAGEPQKNDKEPEIRYVYVSAPPPEGTVVYQSAPSQYAPPTQPSPVPEPLSEEPQDEPEPQPELPPEEPQDEPSDPVPAVSADNDEDEDDKDGDEDNVRVVNDGKTIRYIVMKYSKSVEAKLIQCGDESKGYYSEIKNHLLSYSGIKSRMSWRWETFCLGRKTLAKIKISGKTVSVCLALDPAKYVGSEYYVDDMSDKSSYADTPVQFKIKNPKRLAQAKQLIDEVMSGESLAQDKFAKKVDYAAQFRYENRDQLINKKLIRVTTHEKVVPVTEDN